MSNKRFQLTLFADANQAGSIEGVRKKFNPEQYRLIKCHVTLCREDELENIEKVLKNLIKTNIHPVTIYFGQVIRFAEGKGVLLPAIGGTGEFHELRKSILQSSISTIHKPHPHLTLMHPGNSTCTDKLFDQIKMIELPGKLQFKKVSLIEQVPGNKWSILKEFALP